MLRSVAEAEETWRGRGPKKKTTCFGKLLVVKIKIVSRDVDLL